MRGCVSPLNGGDKFLLLLGSKPRPGGGVRRKSRVRTQKRGRRCGRLSVKGSGVFDRCGRRAQSRHLSKTRALAARPDEP